jgi:beta-mannosidase
MRDVFTACGMDGRHAGNVSCYVVNDGNSPFNGSVQVKAVDLSTGVSDVILHKSVSLPAGPGVREWFAPGPVLPNPSTHALVVSDSEGTEMMAGLVPLNAMALKPAKVACTVGAVQDEVISVTCNSDAVAVYVVLTTAAQGRFEPNAFFLSGSREVKFLSWNGIADADLLKSSLRVDHAAKWPLYPPASPPPP